MDEAGIVDGGKQLSKAEASGKKRSYLRVANVMEAFIRTDNILEMGFSDSEFERFRLHPGDILLNEGQSLELVGRPAMYKGFPTDCAFQNSLIRFRPLPHTDGRFALLLFRYFMRRGTFSAISSKTTSIAHLGLSRFAALSWTFPPLPEQRMIADILGTWDAALEKLDALIVGKQKAKLGLMQQLLSGRRRLPGFKAAWRSVRLSSILSLTVRPIEWTSEKTLHLVSVRRRSGGLFKREPVTASLYKTTDLHSIHAGDFLVSKRQVSHGALAMVRPEFAGCLVSKEYSIFANKMPDRLHMPFLDWLSRTPRIWWLTFVASNGVVKEKLIFDPRDFLKFHIELPSDPEEQRAIVAILDTCDEELRLLGERRKALDLQKQGLMERLLTGALRVCP